MASALQKASPWPRPGLARPVRLETYMANAMQFDFESILDAVRDCDPTNLPGLIGALEQGGSVGTPEHSRRPRTGELALARISTPHRPRRH
jgi:hypothetical protein